MSTASFYERYAHDILRDPFYLRFERKQLWLMGICGPCRFVFPDGVGDWMGNDGTVYGGRAVWGQLAGVGSFCPDGFGVARDVVGEFADAFMGLPKLRDGR